MITDIAYLGPEGTWSHQAARHHFGESARYLPQSGISDVFASVADGGAAAGVVPFENSTEGAVSETLDLLAESEVSVCAQIFLAIEQHLLALGPRQKISRLYSHAQAFGQCRVWLGREMPTVEKIEVSSTARAVQLAAQEPNAGALASRLAAEIYHLPVLAAAIQDRKDNNTRFLVIGRESAGRTGHDRTSLLFGPTRPDCLSGVLRLLADSKIRRESLHSRPARNRPWESVFFIDVSGHKDDQALVQALSDFSKEDAPVRILGSYPATKSAILPMP